MARRSRGGDGSVRGPTSALTNFLASLGVEAQPMGPATDATGQNSDAGPSTIPTPIPEEEEQDSDNLDARPTKRRRAVSVDSDDLDALDTPATGASTPASTSAAASVRRSDLKAIGEFMKCGECAKSFTVTTYTKEHPMRPRTWLCSSCCPKLGVNPFAKPKKAKPAPAKKENRAKIVHYEVAKGVTPLADTCIEILGRYIEEVEALGDIGSINLDKVCKIICKSRRLTPETAKLFYSTERTELVMYDCTNLVHESYLALANLNPNLVKLELHQCGQLMTDTLTAWGKSLKHLKSLELDGPFLARKEGWISFLKARGKQLEHLGVTQSPRIDLDVMETLAKSCPNLKSLRLAEIGKLDSELLAPIAKLKKLQSLAVVSPGGTPIADDAVVSLLAAVGANLTSLDLSDNKELTDDVLKAIAKYCPKLTKLSLRNVDLSDSALKQYFDTLSSSKQPGFTYLDLEKGHDLAGSCLRALTAHSGKTIENLSLVGWRHVEADAVSGLSTCPRLQNLDLGWCRNVTDFTLKDILDGCNSIRTIRVWGCNQLTDRVPRKRGVKVIGIETHAI